MSAMPLLDHSPRLLAAASMADCITDNLATPPAPDYPPDDYSPNSPRWNAQSLSRGAAGVAILHGVRAQTGHGDWDRVRAWLTRAAADDINASETASLWIGAPALAHAIAVSAPGMLPGPFATLDRAVDQLTARRLHTAHARIDRQDRPALAEFDLVHGLSGLGAYQLRHHPDGALLRQVLEYLVRLTEPLTGRAVPGWWSCDPPSNQPRILGGHGNLGMAHGIAGPLALLALAHRAGVSVDGHDTAMTRICTWLDRWRQTGPAGPWWPQRITWAENRTGTPLEAGPARPSWCYGTPGLARALQLAGIALGDPARQQAAEDALTRCLADPHQLGQITDPAICHGWAGLAATVWYAALDARSSALRSHVNPVLHRLLRHATAAVEQRDGLLEGRAGVALVLHSLATGTDIRWATSLCID
ncbi:lanthionine synthetase C family protein [Longispora sp. NPDC051575]|uniref:lanthionine synthetase C family protein n=1 Tax=Longispora sp. NPDC051575 TaxID=3154943 RepID=UPI00342E5AF6